MLKNLVMNFVRDERGAESAECGVTNVLFAGGAVTGGTEFRNAIKGKQDEVIDKLGDVSTD